MTLDTLTFFEIILSGFMAIWTFRHFTNKNKVYSEFEWFGLSVFWGLIIIAVVAQLPYPKMSELLSNPLATGLVTSILGVILGYLATEFLRLLYWIRKILKK